MKRTLTVKFLHFCNSEKLKFYTGKTPFLKSDSHLFLNQALTLGFKMLYFTEEDNLSVYQDDNPVLMRLILQK